MIKFKNYKENNNIHFILSQDLKPENFPAHLYGPVKCGFLDPPGMLIRLAQAFIPKKKYFNDLWEFSDERNLNNGIWAYFREKDKMEKFLNSTRALTSMEYDKIPNALEYDRLRKRVIVP